MNRNIMKWQIIKLQRDTIKVMVVAFMLLAAFTILSMIIIHTGHRKIYTEMKSKSLQYIELYQQENQALRERLELYE